MYSTVAICKKLNLAPESVLYNVLMAGGESECIYEVVCVKDLEKYFNDLNIIQDCLDKKSSYLDKEDVRLSIAEILNKILDVLPSFIGGLKFYGVEVTTDESQIIWDISVLKFFFEEEEE